MQQSQSTSSESPVEGLAGLECNCLGFRVWGHSFLILTVASGLVQASCPLLPTASSDECFPQPGADKNIQAQKKT